MLQVLGCVESEDEEDHLATLCWHFHHKWGNHLVSFFYVEGIE
jgi:hypothetical protein